MSLVVMTMFAVIAFANTAPPEYVIALVDSVAAAYTGYLRPIFAISFPPNR
jgi:hypothetical protein